jgi:hypothetical protein
LVEREDVRRNQNNGDLPPLSVTADNRHVSFTSQPNATAFMVSRVANGKCLSTFFLQVFEHGLPTTGISKATLSIWKKKKKKASVC